MMLSRLAVEYGLSNNSMKELEKMMTEHDMVQHRQKLSIAGIEEANEIINSGSKTFITGPIKAWDEAAPKLREVELISFHNGHATVLVENTFLTIMKEDLLIER